MIWEQLTFEQRKYYIFKSRLELGDSKAFRILKMTLFSITTNKRELLTYKKIIEYADAVIIEKRDIKKSAFDMDEQDYQSILDKTVKLAHEMRLKNSLEYANLFSYLLWNGYLSENRKFQFQSKRKKMETYSIMKGYGVCYNISWMLTDFLNRAKFASAVLTNTFPSVIRLDYIFPTDRSMKISQNKLAEFIRCQNIQYSGNHAFSLIDDNGLYIYDATNLFILGLDDQTTAHIIAGKAKFPLHPFFSYALAKNEQEIEVLEALLAPKNLHTPYDRKTFIEVGENNMQYFEASSPIIEEYYADIEKNIDSIATRQRVRKNK